MKTNQLLPNDQSLYYNISICNFDIAKPHDQDDSN
jgi:hypothetical protein